MAFRPDFVWGAGTSSYQVEGAAKQDGRADSVWDVFCRTPGKVYRGHTGDVACDHVNRYREDVAIMKRIGLQAYRFSVSWPRVMPDVTGRVNDAGLAFYDRLVDELLGAGIEPWVTLFHWDSPQAMEDRGGWRNRDSAAWLGEYAAVVADRLSDRVSKWITINEPQIFIGMGHKDGTNAPGLTLPTKDWLLAAHHALMGHGMAAQAIRAHAKKAPTVGWAPIGRVRVPATDSAADLAAARLATNSVLAKDQWNNTWFGDPVVLGRYPEDGLALFGAEAPQVRAGDMETICQPLDFYGINVYDAELYRAGADGKPELVTPAPGHPRTAFNWPIVPSALYWGPKFLYERYKLPIIVTENGLSNTDWVNVDGEVDDPQRIDYTRRYLRELRRASEDGADIRGYFHWSLLDNFEWAEGYNQRFGLVHVDFATQKRTPKRSAHWYREVIAARGANL